MTLEIEPGAARRDYRAAVSHLTKAIVTAISSFAAADAAAAAIALSKAIPNLVDVATSLEGKKELQNLAWDLVRGCYAAALARFFSWPSLNGRFKSAELEFLVDSLLTRAELLASQGQQRISAESLISPLSIPILRDAARQVAHELKRFPDVWSPGRIRRVFEECLVEGLKDVRKQKAADFRMLEEALDGPLARAIEKRAALSRHGEFLIRAFTQLPVFGQEKTGATLSDLYVRQTAIWRTREELRDSERVFSDEERVSAGSGAHPRPKFRHLLHVGRLHDTLWEWQRKKLRNDAVRVVAGGPGSGKSTFAKAFAIEAIDSAEFDVLYVPLQEIEATGSFESRIASLFKSRTELGFDRTDTPLSWLGQGEIDGTPPSRPLLLICDGLDEIAPPETSESANATADFIQALNNWLANRNSAGCYVLAIVLGRTIAAEEAFRKLGIDVSALLRVGGLLPIERSDEWQMAQDTNQARDPQKLAGIDERQTYWSNWCRSIGASEIALPEALRGESEAARALEELTSEPLLLYLLLWTEFVGDRWKEAANNRNVVYEEIFRRIFSRDWGKDEDERSHPSNLARGGHTLARNLRLEDFFALQEALGLAAWAGGGRTATSEAFEIMLKLHLTEEQRSDLGATAAAVSLKSVALQSYTRSVGANGGGYEFVHKTLGEYLIARGLVSAATRALAPLSTRVLEGRCRDAAFNIGKIARVGNLTDEIHRFFVDEVRLRVGCAEAALRQIQTLTPALNWVLRSGIPIHRLVPITEETTFSSLDHAERRALDVTWSFGQALASLAFPFSIDGRPQGWEPGPLRIDWSSNSAFASLFSRLADRVYLSAINRMPTFDFLDLRDQNLSQLTFSDSVTSSTGYYDEEMGVSLRGANLQGVEAYSSNFRHANFSAANMEGCNLAGCWFDGALLAKTNLRDSNFVGSSFGYATLIDADCSGAQFGSADFLNTDLSNGNFSRVSLDPFPLIAAQGALQLKETQFIGAICKGANFVDCDFSNSKISGVEFTGAKLSGANFALAMFESANFADADLARAILSEDGLEIASQTGGKIDAASSISDADITAGRAALVARIRVRFHQKHPDQK
jgi:uncharacterized protein YjbI with pentapeptide repeats